MERKLAGSAGSIYVDLLLRDGRYRQGLNNSSSHTRKWSGQVRNNTQQAERAFEGVLNPVKNLNTAIGFLGVSLAGALSVSSIIDYADKWKQMEGRLGLVVKEATDLKKVQDELYEIAVRTRQPLESVTNLYARMGQIIPDNLKANLDLLGITEAVSTSLAITGETSLSAQAAIVQFTQALATDFEAAGQEIRSIQEQAPRLALALTRALGDGSKSLRQLVDEGAVSVEAIGRAFREGQPEFEILRKELEKIPPTTRQAFTELNNAFLKFIGNSEAAGQGVSAIALAVRGLARNLETVISLAGALSLILAGRGLAGLFPKISEGFRKSLESTNASLTKAAVAQQAYNLQSLKSVRVLEAVEKQQKALNGVMSKTPIVVDAAGNAAVATTTKMLRLKAVGAGILGIFGGPLGAALTATAGAAFFLTTRLTEAEKVAEKYSETFMRLSSELTDTSKKVSEFSEALKNERVADFKKEIESLEKSIKKLNEEVSRGIAGGVWDRFLMLVSNPIDFIRFNSAVNDIQESFRDTGDIEAAELAYSKLFADFPEFYNLIKTQKEELTALKTVMEESANAAKKLNSEITQSNFSEFSASDMEKILKGEYTYKDAGGIETPKINNKPEKTVSSGMSQFEKQQKELESIFKRYESVITGVKQEEIERARVIQDLTSLLGSEYIPNQEALTQAIYRYDESLKENSKNVNKWGIDISEIGKAAAENIQEAFADFLFDPFEKGTQGMLESFGKAIQKMLAQAAAADLVRVLFGGDNTVGLFDSIFSPSTSSSIPLPSRKPELFADGGFLRPRSFGIVGEEGPELIYGGNSGQSVIPLKGMSGGGNVNVNIINNGNSQVSTQERRTADGMDIQVMIDQAVAEKIATPGSRTNRALSAFSSRGLTGR